MASQHARPEVADVSAPAAVEAEPSTSVSEEPAAADFPIVVRCLITPEATPARCEVVRTSGALPPERDVDAVVLAIYLRRWGLATPRWVDYTFQVRLTRRDSPPPPSAASPNSMLHDMAVFLCRHDMLKAPALEYLPDALNPSLVIRREDLLVLGQAASAAPPGLAELREDMAHFVWCEVTRLQVDGGAAIVELRRHTPRWEEAPPELLARTASDPDVKNRIASLLRWIQDSGVARDVTTHVLRFVETTEGWGADYQLAERARPRAQR